jgi:phosphoribosyl-dephospho-CoA transferase
MARRQKKIQQSQTKLQDLVAVTAVDSIDQARDYETLLKNNDIATVIKQQHDEATGTETFAVMVPEDCLDEAHVVIESQNAFDDFYDFAVDDEENEFDGDLFEDEF